jgi:hypothetical protein
MTAEEYEAIEQLQRGVQTATPRKPDTGAGVQRMNHAERASYVAERLKKLNPRKRDGVVRSIEAMFQFNGGIDTKEVENLLATLQKRKFFTITQDGKVIYGNG